MTIVDSLRFAASLAASQQNASFNDINDLQNLIDIIDDFFLVGRYRSIHNTVTEALNTGTRNG